MRIGFENWDEQATTIRAKREVYNHEPVTKDGVPLGIQTISAAMVGAFGATVIGGIILQALAH
jgi:hypothetical protein